MSLKRYLKDKIISIIIYILLSFVIFLLLLAFKLQTDLMITIIAIIVFMVIIPLIIDYIKKKKFYDFFKNNLNSLDKKYLIQEIITKPNFYEGEILYDSLYEINKSMVENINEYKNNIDDFKEYVEMWIHEVKIPISSLILINHNDKKDTKKYALQIKNLDNYIDQILYYVRSEIAEKDFIIKETSLDKIISNVAFKNKDEIIAKNINFIVDVKDIKILTDSKWLEFILNQIINNSIKYKKEKDSIIKISAIEDNQKVTLKIYDNGIGIIDSDLSRVFEKSFTGENGRDKIKSTGMGLYIVKKLCNKLEHKIEISSEINRYTEIRIIFDKNDYFKMK